MTERRCGVMVHSTRDIIELWESLRKKPLKRSEKHRLRKRLRKGDVE